MSVCYAEVKAIGFFVYKFVIDEISLLVRILEVVDIYDALSSDRPYRKAFPPKKAIEELRRLKDKMDQRVVDVMANIIS